MNSLKLLLIAVVCFLLTVQCSDQQQPTPIPTHQLENYLNQVYEAYPLPGLAVVVVSGDQSFTFTSGYRQIEDSLPFTKQTMFFGGELSEVMVASAMMKLANHGRLQLMDQVATHIPYFQMEGNYQQVSVHHLLTHTSGIPNFSPAWDMPALDEEALAATTRSIMYQPLEFEPGTRARRSAYNIDIAADLLQNIEKAPFEEVIGKHYLQPMGLTSSTFDFRQFDSANLAKPHHVGHWLTYEQRLNEIYPYTRENVGSYGFHTTVNDLEIWMKLVLTHQPDGLFQTHYKTGKDTFKGYGWDIFRHEGELIYNNHWGAGGFSADMSLMPDAQLGVFVFSNTMDDFNPAVISSQLLARMKGEELPVVKMPVHIAMSKMLAEGRCMEEVLNWFQLQVDDPASPYELNATLLGQLGINLLHRLQKPEDAIKVFELAVAQYPASPQAYLNLTEGLLVSGRIVEAEKAFDQAMELDASPNAYVTFLKERLQVEIESLNNT